MCRGTLAGHTKWSSVGFCTWEYYMLLLSITICIRKHMNSLFLSTFKLVINFYSLVYWTFPYKCCKQNNEAHQLMFQMQLSSASNLSWDLLQTSFCRPRFGLLTRHTPSLKTPMCSGSEGCDLVGTALKQVNVLIKNDFCYEIEISGT